MPPGQRRLPASAARAPNPGCDAPRAQACGPGPRQPPSSRRNAATTALTRPGTAVRAARSTVSPATPAASGRTGKRARPAATRGNPAVPGGRHRLVGQRRMVVHPPGGSGNLAAAASNKASARQTDTVSASPAIPLLQRNIKTGPSAVPRNNRAGPATLIGTYCATTTSRHGTGESGGIAQFRFAQLPLGAQPPHQPRAQHRRPDRPHESACRAVGISDPPGRWPASSPRPAGGGFPRRGQGRRTHSRLRVPNGWYPGPPDAA